MPQDKAQQSGMYSRLVTQEQFKKALNDFKALVFKQIGLNNDMLNMDLTLEGDAVGGVENSDPQTLHLALKPTGVSAGTYDVVTVDSKGRVMSGSNPSHTVSSADVVAALGYTPYNSTNPNHYLTTITLDQITSTLGYVPYSAANPAGYITTINSAQVVNALGFIPYSAANPLNFISGITYGNVVTALGYTPYNATNPYGYTSNTGTVTSVSVTADEFTVVVATPTTTPAAALSLVQPHVMNTASTAAITTTQTYLPVTMPIAANSMKAGDTYRITLIGRFSTALLGTSTFNVRLGTAGAIADAAIQSVTLNSALSGTNVAFEARFLISVRSIGATGSVLSTAVISNNGVLGLVATGTSVIDAGTAVTVNTTQALKLGVSFVTSAASVSAIFDQTLIERVR